ncbi:unnamed protein product [Tuber melanosporum]|uniref:(Perigord truffle) hypothetical protein n=1 Tax=Tuber melanosporum (strain Mel28) TaxID=656061 RepID=D5G4S4_TUBMM|nr:uncharacterized protein GSTUM_00000077001 [Tuber melanosporum]CAZ79510.1 unnamed protein product [Tuber melanosporum]
MSDDGYSDTYSDDFAPYDDYYEDDDLAALVDAMAETAFAQGDPIWDDFDVDYDTTEYHSDWEEYYSDGEFYEEEVVVPNMAGGGGKGGGVDGKKSEVVGTGVVERGRGGGPRAGRRMPPRKRRKIEEKGVGVVGVSVGATVMGTGEDEAEDGGRKERPTGANPITATEGKKNTTVIVPVAKEEKRNGTVIVGKEKDGPAKAEQGAGAPKLDTRKRKPSVDGNEILSID